MITRAPRISARKKNSLVKCFALGTTAKQAAAIAKVNRKCANRWYRHFRELIYQALARTPRFAGEVEIDQKYITGRGSRSKKRSHAEVKQLMGLTRKQIRARIKGKKGPRIEVVGFWERASGRIYTHVVHKSDAATLVPLIRVVIEKGGTIYTDKWAAFNVLTADGYKHYAINHSVEYKDRRGRHINGIERYWSFMQHQLNRFYGLPRSTLPLHIKECEWRYNNESPEKAIKALLSISNSSARRPPIERRSSAKAPTSPSRGSTRAKVADSR